MTTCIHSMPTPSLVRMHAEVRKQGDVPTLERAIRAEVERRVAEDVAAARRREARR